MNLGGFKDAISWANVCHLMERRLKSSLRAAAESVEEAHADRITQTSPHVYRGVQAGVTGESAQECDIVLLLCLM